MTQLRQCDACSQNVLKCLGYCMKQTDSILPWGLYSDNTQRTSKRGENISHASTSLFSPWFDVICALSEYRRTAKWNLFVNRPFPNCFEPHNESEAKCKVFVMKISFHSYANKTNFLMKRFALSLTFIVRFTATRKWPIIASLSKWKNLLEFILSELHVFIRKLFKIPANKQLIHCSQRTSNIKAVLGLW